jgi:glycosyltransferase involved in cell wall biosynthesis
VSIAGGGAAAGDVKVTVGIPTRNRSRWLRQAIESVLAQTYAEFRLVISDNASTDDTAAVVASFDDPRLSYHRSSVDLGMFGNLNRVSELAETEYVVVLPDDDLLYPDYLSSVVSILERHPYVSVAHSAFDVIDEHGTVIERGRVLLPSDGETTMETGPQLIERSMRRSGTVCWTSACFRTAALRAAGGIRAEDELYADGPLMMRIALHGGFCGFSRALVAVRVHPTAESASVGQFAGAAYRPLDDAPGFLYRQRLAFLDEARLPAKQDRRYRQLAGSAYRRETLGRLTYGLRAGDLTLSQALKRLSLLGSDDPRMLLSRATLKLAAILFVGALRRPRG